MLFPQPVSPRLLDIGQATKDLQVFRGQALHHLAELLFFLRGDRRLGARRFVLFAGDHNLGIRQRQSERLDRPLHLLGVVQIARRMQRHAAVVQLTFVEKLHRAVFNLDPLHHVPLKQRRTL